MMSVGVWGEGMMSVVCVGEGMMSVVCVGEGMMSVGVGGGDDECRCVWGRG